MASDVQVVQSHDYRGLLCPLPVIKLARAIKTIQVGDVLELIADDPGAPADMRAWAKQTGNTLLSTHEQGGAFHFYVRRDK